MTPTRPDIDALESAHAKAMAMPMSPALEWAAAQRSLAYDVVRALPALAAYTRALEAEVAALRGVRERLLSDEAVADAWSALFDAGGSGNEQGVRAALNAASLRAIAGSLPD